MSISNIGSALQRLNRVRAGSAPNQRSRATGGERGQRKGTPPMRESDPSGSRVSRTGAGPADSPGSTREEVVLHLPGVGDRRHRLVVELDVDIQGEHGGGVQLGGHWRHQGRNGRYCWSTLLRTSRPALFGGNRFLLS